LNGEVRELRWGGPAALSRRQFVGSAPADRAKIFEKFLGTFLSNFALTGASLGNLDKYDQTLTLDYKFQVAGYAKTAGDLLIVRPRVLGENGSSILTGKPRKYPIEFGEATLQTDNFDIALPAGYVVDELPPAVRAVCDLQAEHGFAGEAVEAVTVTGNRRMIERHAILEPADLMLAQYSIPFCVALALFREARDPESYDESALADPRLRALCRRVRLVPEAADGHGAMGSTVTVTLADGRHFERHEASGLLEAGELEDKFTRLTRGALGEPGAARLFARLQRLEDEASLDWLGA